MKWFKCHLGVISGDRRACSGSGRPGLLSYAVPERPSKPSYTAEGSRLEVPSLKLHQEQRREQTKNTRLCVVESDLAKALFQIPATVSRTLVSTFCSSNTDSSTVSTFGSFSLARASNSYSSSSSVSVGSMETFPGSKDSCVWCEMHLQV